MSLHNKDLAVSEPTAALPDDHAQQQPHMFSHSRDKAQAETEPTAASPDDHSQQHSHMSSHPRDKALPETEPTAAHADVHSNVNQIKVDQSSSLHQYSFCAFM